MHSISILKRAIAPAGAAVFVSVSLLFAQDECLEKGTALFGQKKYKKVIMTLKKCDSSPKASQLLGISYYELNYMEEAKEYLKKAIAESPENMDIKIRYATAFARNRQFKKAVEEFRKLVETYPDNRDVRAGYAQALGWNRKYDQAIEEYQALLEKDPRDFESWIQLGIITSWDKKFKEAVDIYKAICTAQPSEKHEIDARLNLAEVLSWMKQFDESIAEYDKVIALAPKDARGFMGKGKVLEWQGKYKAAIRIYEQALQADPGNKDAQARLQQLMWVK
ncbi:MAG: tetratricopeptide repeat protein [Chitinivibrionales bacterium]|nr:tetratricopeptide repeat protein [Chitinivibrionales bacterium]